MDYRSAGVDIDAATEALGPIRKLAQSTFRPGVLSEIGSFGGLFQIDKDKYEQPVLVASTDGVGTKLKIAFATGRHNTVGYDLVGHCVNDILVQGARPLFFLDYLATGKLASDDVVSVVEGIARACREFGLSLLGGETAEMPGFYPEGEYDLAGTIVGVVEKERVIDGSGVTAGDQLIALPSVGLHTNGYSLARKILFDGEGLNPESAFPGLDESIADVLLRPHPSYLSAVEPFLDREPPVLKALVHVTGGGLTDNIPRVLPTGLAARVDLSTWSLPPHFRALMELGPVAQEEMLRAFNVGVGWILIVSPDDAAQVVSDLESRGESPFVIGAVERAEDEASVRYEGSF